MIDDYEDYGADYYQQEQCERQQWEAELWRDDIKERSIEGGF